ncbi:MAG: methyl-accepting chemotaxis protein [Desulfobacteraceae bacterium]|nr:MAG: methyl-accepting chemotaxis protein [Desulfobacteraceae bacterium]
MNKDNRRHLKNLYINKEIQNKVIVMNLIYMCVIAILIMGIMLSHSTESLLFKEAKTGVSAGMSLSVKLYILIGISFMLAIVSQLWLTHKICGALINFSHVYDRITQGDLTHKVNLRESDFLHEEAHLFNTMLDNLTNLVAELKKDNQHLSAALQDLTPEKLDPQKIEEINALMKNQTDCLAKLALPEKV